MCKHRQQRTLQQQPAAPSAAAAKQQSPRDWQLDRKYTLSEVQQHSSLDDCWMVIFDKVYNITEFVDEHPGGDFILLEYAGRDATHPFLSSRHGSSAYKMLDKYWIGILVDEELYYSNNSSYCSVYSNLSWRSTPTLEETAAGSGKLQRADHLDEEQAQTSEESSDDERVEAVAAPTVTTIAELEQAEAEEEEPVDSQAEEEEDDEDEDEDQSDGETTSSSLGIISRIQSSFFNLYNSHISARRRRRQLSQPPTATRPQMRPSPQNNSESLSTSSLGRPVEQHSYHHRNGSSSSSHDMSSPEDSSDSLYSDKRTQHLSNSNNSFHRQTTTIMSSNKHRTTASYLMRPTSKSMMNNSTAHLLMSSRLDTTLQYRYDDDDSSTDSGEETASECRTCSAARAHRRRH